MLHHKIIGAGPPLVFLHGLFGSSDNWQTLARRFAEPDEGFGESRTCILLDLRNHGRSPHLDAHGYAEMAADVAQFLADNWIHEAAVLGHSMGGKVAMTLALAEPDLVSELVVVDMGPQAYKRGHDEIFRAMRRLPLTQNRSRGELDALLRADVPEAGVRQFLLKNLRREREGYAWKLNLDVIERDYPRILEAVTAEAPFEGPALFVRGAESGYVRDGDWPGIQALFPAAELVTVAGAGHWVHAEQPEALYGAVRGFLSAG